MRGLVPRLLVAMGLWAMLWPGRVAEAQRRIPVNLESTPPGARVYLDSEGTPPIAVTPKKAVRIPRGPHVLIFKLEGYQTARLSVDVRRRRETFRVVLQPLGTLYVTAGNSDAQGAAVLVDGRPVGNVPYRQEMRPGRYLVQVRRDGFKTFEMWVELQGGQVFTLPVSLEREAPPAGSILVAADVSGAPVFLDGEPRGVTPTVLEDVPEGEHVVEIRPVGADPFRKTVLVRAGQRAVVSASLRAAPAESGSLRVLTVPPGASVSVDGEPVGTSPVTKEGLAPGEHIVEATLSGYQPTRETVQVESGQQRVVSLELQEEARRPGRIVVNATASGAVVYVDGDEKGPPPVVVENAPPGTHAIMVKAPGYQDFRTTCDVGPDRDCEVLARMDPVGTPVRVEANARGARFVVDGEDKGPVPWEGSLPIGSHRIEVRAPGYQPHVEQVSLQPSSETRVFRVVLLKEGEVAPEEREERARARMRALREATSFSAGTLPVEQTLLDFSLGWPYTLEVRMGVGILPWLEAGFTTRSFFRITEFEGRVKVGKRLVRQFAVGAQARFGGGIGPSIDATSQELSLDMAADDHPTNNVFFSLEGLASLHFSEAGAFTVWLALDAFSDRWDWCEEDSDRFPAPGGAAGCTDTPASGLDYSRQNQARLRLGGSLEIVLSRRWNVWGLLEGVIAGPEDGRRLYGDIFGFGTDDTKLYMRAGVSYKFGAVRPEDREPEGSGATAASRSLPDWL